MLHQHTSFFGPMQKMLAQAMHAAGHTDREIADANHTSVNNIIAWRKEEGLPEHLSADAKARAAEESYSPPVRRPATSAAVPGLITPEQAQVDYVAPVQPTGDNALEIGLYLDKPVFVDLEELLTTRLLIQGNSGSGKSHLLRRLLEECAGIVQQVIIDPEGDFVSFGEAFGHTVVQAKDYTASRILSIATKARHLRGSVVLSLEGMEIEQQMDAVSALLNGLFDAPPEHWHPILVAIDEAHLFAPTGDNGEDKETRKTSQQAVANLMCRGRKRGLAGIIATQRLSKLHKNVAAEASNFLLGRTFLDIDIARAADLLGLPRAQAEDIRNLNRGEFLGLGPAIARRPQKVKVGSVMTQGKAGPEKGLTPLPNLTAEAMQSLMLADEDEDDGAKAPPALRIVG